MQTWVCFSRGCPAGLGAIWPVIPRCTSSEAGAASPFASMRDSPFNADSRSSMNLPYRSTASIWRPGKFCSSAAGSSIKSVLPSVTERIRRPRIACRNPRATVSTSGSSGIREPSPQNNTPLQPSPRTTNRFHLVQRQSLLVVIRIRRMLGDHYQILLQRLQRHFHRLLELPVVARRNRRRIVFHLIFRRVPLFPNFHFPFNPLM